MKREQDLPEAKAALRRAAEARLKEKPATQPPQTEADERRLQHELEVHQVELEMQNEELQASWAESEAGVERYSDLFDFAPVGYFDLAADGTIRLVNLTGASLVGLGRAELTGRRFQKLLTGADRTAFNDFLQRVFATQTRQAQEIRLLRKDQPRLHVQIEARLSPNGGSCRLAMLDITERKRAEEKLIAVMQAVESTSDAVGISDAQGRHFYQNRALSELFEYATAEELQAAGGGAAVIKDPEVAREMFTNIQSGKPWAGELELVTKSGRAFPAYERADAIKDQAGNLIGLIGIITDISERKRAEAEREKLEAQNRQLQKSESLGRMAGAIAHNFNNQLAAVIMNLELALQELPANAGPGADVSAALQSARKAAGISTQMLTYLGQTHGQLGPLDLSATCRQSLPLLQAAFPKTVVLETDLAAPGPVINANASQIQQVLINLLTNAWEASGKGSGAIGLTVKQVSAAAIPAVRCKTPYADRNTGERQNIFHCCFNLRVNCGLTPEIEVREGDEDHHHQGSHYFFGPPTGAGPSFVLGRSGGKGQALELRFIRRRGQVAYPHHDHRRDNRDQDAEILEVDVVDDPEQRAFAVVKVRIQRAGCVHQHAEDADDEADDHRPKTALGVETLPEDAKEEHNEDGWCQVALNGL